MALKTPPDGYGSVTPMLIVEGAEKLIDFAKTVFGAQERLRMPMPDGTIGHAELTIGDGLIMVADATQRYQAAQATVHVYVQDVDATYRLALEAGATTDMEPADQFYGDRAAGVIDPTGVRWSLATHVEDVSPEEMTSRMAAMGPTT